MTRMSKKGERRNQCPKRPAPPSPKTGPLKDNLPSGFKAQINALESEIKAQAYIAKIK